MIITQTANQYRQPQTYKHTIDEQITIRKAAKIYGHTDDIIRLYDDEDNLLAIAVWPQGSKAYKYCTSPDKQHLPGAWRY